jgi:hypothetical protein
MGMDRFGEESMPYLILGFFALFLPMPVVSYLRSRKKGRRGA